MKRTQIYLPEKEHAEIKRLADATGTSIAEVIRGYVEVGLKKNTNIDKSGKKVMMDLMNMRFSGGPPDLSINHDHYLYGAPKKKYKKK
ncbi:MAG: CopG family transcriptional regulator [Candidatus Roizmanbacteria bacterium]